MSVRDGTTGLPPPAASALSPSNNAAGGLRSTAILPIARAHPLRPASQKEIALINYADDKILRINRRYAKKFSNAQTDLDDALGYTNLDQLIQDLNPVFDVVWISGTASIQIPYMLSLAGLLCSYMPAFSFSSSIFRFAKRLDLAFASLLQRRSSTDNEHMRQVSMTERVRIKSLIEETRVTAVNVASSSGHPQLDSATSDEDTEDNDRAESSDDESENQSYNISIGLSRIYKQTMEILGDALT